jgi:hypothetical protein
MSLFDDNDDLNSMFNDWEKRRREHMKKMKDEGKSEGDKEDVLNNLFDSVSNFTTTNEDFSKLSELGEPDSIREFEEAGLKFIEKKWKTEDGEYVLIESVGSISGSDLEEALKNSALNGFNIKEVSLEDALEDALEEENYEEAARLRDEIKDREIFNKK